MSRSPRSKMAWLLISAAMFMSYSSWASPGDVEVLSQETLTVKGPEPKAAFEKAEAAVAAVLELYRPAAVGYTDYQVIASGPLGLPRMSFLADVNVLGIHRKGQVIADVSHTRIVCQAPALPEGFRYTMDLQASDPMLSDHLGSYLVELCLRPSEGDSLMIDATASMVEGPRYRMPLGPVAKSVFRAQLPAVLKALSTLIGR